MNQLLYGRYLAGFYTGVTLLLAAFVLALYAFGLKSPACFLCSCIFSVIGSVLAAVSVKIGYKSNRDHDITYYLDRAEDRSYMLGYLDSYESPSGHEMGGATMSFLLCLLFVVGPLLTFWERRLRLLFRRSGPQISD